MPEAARRWKTSAAREPRQNPEPRLLHPRRPVGVAAAGLPLFLKVVLPMALKATIYKAQIQLADMDRGLYADHHLTLARHPSETDERMMVRVLAFVLNVPAQDHHGALEFAKGLSDVDEPELWQKDLTGALQQWIDIGQPDDKRLIRACGRSSQVAVYCYSASTPIWWRGIASKLTRVSNLSVWQLAAESSLALAALAERSMSLQISVQEGTVWITKGETTVEITPTRLL